MPVTPIAALIDHARTHPKRIAFIHDHDIWTYGRLSAEVQRLAAGMRRHGIQKGDRVALHMRNVPELVLAYYACFSIGAIAVPLDIKLRAIDLRTVLMRLRPSLYIGQLDLYDKIESVEASVLPKDARFVFDGPVATCNARRWTTLFGDRINGDHIGETVSDSLDSRDPAILLMTAGATGESKFVIHTQETLSASLSALVQLDLDGDQVAIAALPMTHAYGFFTFLACLQFGVPIILLERFDADAMLNAIECHHVSWLCLLPRMFAALLDRQGAARQTVSSLRHCLTVGDVCPPQLHRDFPHHFGLPLGSFWASTEAFGSLIPGSRIGSMGRVGHSTEFRLVDDAGSGVTQGETGELMLRGTHISPGYWIAPGQSVDCTKDGWLSTGDLMRQGENNDLWFVRRRKDLVISQTLGVTPMKAARALAGYSLV